jgi:hypothetical protein
VGYPHIGIRIRAMQRRQVNVKFYFWTFVCTLGRCNEPGIAVLQDDEEVWVGGIHSYRHAPDFDHQAETFDFGS